MLEPAPYRSFQSKYQGVSMGVDRSTARNRGAAASQFVINEGYPKVVLKA
jgi:hypothetical protein